MKSRLQLLLLGESFSPWTKKARWALERCGVPYEYREYTPTLSEPALRWRMRKWSGPVSVPVLFSGQKAIRGSWEIACLANEMSGNGRLGDMATSAAWNTLSEHALAEGRTRVVRCILGSDRALEESLPAFIPNPLRRPLRFVARHAVRRLDRKYAHLVNSGALHKALVATRDALTDSGGDYLLGEFGYADITMAVVLEIIAPIALTVPSLGPATTACWQDPALASEFGDLLRWRDRLAANSATNYSQFHNACLP